jgi:regulation of enolase protein 1 (concanavalin A-like superfamily)
VVDLLPAPVLDGVPPLRWHARPEKADASGNRLTITAPAGTDWFVDPRSGDHADGAPALLFDVDGDFALSARVTVAFAGTFDAGVLCLRQSADRWAKLCFERSPQGQAMVVSVVTRGSSDDANSVVVDGTTVHLRVCRTGRAYAFHHSSDGHTWHFVRFFTLEDDGAPASAGFLAQAPDQQPCSVVFEDVALAPAVPADLRDGS